MRSSAVTLSVLAGTAAVTVLVGYFLFFRKRAKKPAKQVRQHEFNFHCSPDRGDSDSAGTINKVVSVTRRRHSSSPHSRTWSPHTSIDVGAICYGRRASGDNQPPSTPSFTSLEDEDVTSPENLSNSSQYSESSNTESSEEPASSRNEDLEAGSSTDVDIVYVQQSPLSAEQFNEYLNSPIVNSFADDTRMRFRQTSQSVESTEIVTEYDNAAAPSVVTETYNRIYNTYHQIVPSLEPNTKPMFFSEADKASG